MSMNSLTTSLSLLGLSPDYLPREKKVKRAYRKKAMLIHPDRAGIGSTKDFQLLQSAYTTVLEFIGKGDIDEETDDSTDD